MTVKRISGGGGQGRRPSGEIKGVTFFGQSFEQSSQRGAVPRQADAPKNRKRRGKQSGGQKKLTKDERVQLGVDQETEAAFLDAVQTVVRAMVGSKANWPSAQAARLNELGPRPFPLRGRQGAWTRRLVVAFYQRQDERRKVHATLQQAQAALEKTAEERGVAVVKESIQGAVCRIDRPAENPVLSEEVGRLLLKRPGAPP